MYFKYDAALMQHHVASQGMLYGAPSSGLIAA